jgi:hypothetical protein
MNGFLVLVNDAWWEDPAGQSEGDLRQAGHRMEN